ncbi:MAG: PhoD-like phosphatase N-terminal domain-containing protein, partial [Rhodospirillaceae bacterium]|nr:PhoD-like phosphatase N-terminal domain-containing protein [Rhodospirillaceae bacterium]
MLPGTPIGRREFIRYASLVAGTYSFGALSHVVSAQTAVRSGIAENSGVFPQGVASADPQPDAILLWTRAVPEDGAADSVDLIVQLARTPSFDDLVLEQPVTAVADCDYTVRVLVERLQPDTVYYYRFVAGDGSASRTGRT